jgi:hypothetical protein
MFVLLKISHFNKSPFSSQLRADKDVLTFLLPKRGIIHEFLWGVAGYPSIRGRERGMG